MEATFSSETSVEFHLTTGRYIPEDIILHNLRDENLKSSIYIESYELTDFTEFYSDTAVF
jgi:hypothetical protein